MKKIYIVPILLSLLTASCEEFLETTPSAPTSTFVLNNESEIEVVLNSAYNDVDLRYDFCCGAEYTGTIMLDHVTDIAWNRSDGSSQDAGEGNPDNSLGIYQRYWESYYRGLSKVNFVIDEAPNRAADNVEEAVLNDLIGQAKFLRAFFHYQLAVLYGDVILEIGVPDITNDNSQPLTDQSAVLDAVQADITDALSSLSKTESSKNRANYYTALALQARLALYREDYALALSSAQEVIDDGGYALYDDYRNLFTQEGEGNQEVIFSSGYLTNNRDWGAVQLMGPRRAGGNGWSILIPTRQLVDSYETVNGLPIDEDTSYDPADRYSNRDPRLYASIFTSGSAPDAAFDSEFTFISDPGNDTPDATSGGRSRSGFVWKKYVDAAGLSDNRNVGIDVIMMRLAEMYLIVAEANIESGIGDPNTAVDAINMVRARAYSVAPSDTDNYPEITTNNVDELRTILRRERKIELAGEGLRLVDIRRWGIAEHVMPGKIYGNAQSTDELAIIMAQTPSIDEYGRVTYADESGFTFQMGAGERTFDPSVNYFWPIPLSEVDSNDQID